MRTVLPLLLCLLRPSLLARLSRLYPILFFRNKCLYGAHGHSLRRTHHQLTCTYHLESKGFSLRPNKLVVFSHNKVLRYNRWVALAPGGCHATSSKYTASAISTAVCAGTARGSRQQVLLKSSIASKLA